VSPAALPALMPALLLALLLASSPQVASPGELLSHVPTSPPPAAESGIFLTAFDQEIAKNIERQNNLPPDAVISALTGRHVTSRTYFS
jgi:hypothetical protein